MEEISLSGEGPGSAGPLYYSDMNPLKAVKLMTRGELRDETGARRKTSTATAEKGCQRSSKSTVLDCKYRFRVERAYWTSAPFGHLHRIRLSQGRKKYGAENIGLVVPR